jgi:hypothetical protein
MIVLHICVLCNPSIIPVMLVRTFMIRCVSVQFIDSIGHRIQASGSRALAGLWDAWLACALDTAVSVGAASKVTIPLRRSSALAPAETPTANAMDGDAGESGTDSKRHGGKDRGSYKVAEATLNKVGTAIYNGLCGVNRCDCM